ncbi:MAG TPA: hypothetical protein VLE70_02035, partial [Anaerolineae bacterium]|nr:hypothetical protein [Anaerolineae bacterium]
GGGELTNQHLGFQRAFFDHYYPVPPTEPLQPPADFAGRAGRFEGSYRITRGSSTNLEKLMGLLVDITISDAGDDTLLLNTPYGEWRMVEVEPLYFRDVDGRFGFAFREDGQGRITQLSTDITPMFAFEKLAWYETPGFNMALALACVLVFLSIIPVVLVRFARNRRLSDDRKSTPRETRLAHWLILAISVLNLLFLSGMMLWVDLVPLYGASLNHGIVLGLGVLAAVLTVGALVYTVLAWKNRYWGIAARVNYTLATVAAIAFVWFLNQWNLLGWRF